jgi:hypothetical protein
MYLVEHQHIMQQILEKQNGYQYLDSKPQTLTAKAHRPSYGTDGDYFSKPSAEDIYEKIYAMMNETNPMQFLICTKFFIDFHTNPNHCWLGFFYR